MVLRSLFRFAPLLLFFAVVYASREQVKQLFSAVANVGLEAKTDAEMSGLVKVLQLDLIAGSSLPDDIVEYARDRMNTGGTDPGLDSWQTPWLLETEPDGTVLLISCGPDRDCNNDDDLLYAVTGPGGVVGEE